MNIEPHKNGKVERPVVVNTKWLPLTKADEPTMRRIWPRVRLGCLAIKALDKNGDAGNWTPEHVRFQLDAGFRGQSRCELWQIMDRSGEMIGFLVTIPGNCPYLNVPNSLIVWIAYTFSPMVRFGKQSRAMGRAVLEQLEGYARDSGLRFVDGYSNNIQWIRWLDWCGKGYRSSQILFRKDVWKD